MFLVLLVVGLVGLAVMAMPALGRHAGAVRGGHHAALHAGHIAKLAAGQAASKALVHASPTGMTRFLPSPRLVFSLVALYGAFGNVLVALELPVIAAALLAIVPAALVERFLVTPLWRFLFGFQGQPSGSLEELVLAEATAVTPFKKGKGIVSVVRDGRVVQFAARLVDAEANLPVKVGDRLRIEDIEPARERVTVSVPRE